MVGGNPSSKDSNDGWLKSPFCAKPIWPNPINKSINKKLNDVLTSLTKGIKNLGVKSFIDNLKNNDKTLLENIAKKHSTNKLLKNDNKEANLDDTILSM